MIERPSARATHSSADKIRRDSSGNLPTLYLHNLR